MHKKENFTYLKNTNRSQYNCCGLDAVDRSLSWQRHWAVEPLRKRLDNCYNCSNIGPRLPLAQQPLQLNWTVLVEPMERAEFDAMLMHSMRSMMAQPLSFVYFDSIYVLIEHCFPLKEPNF
jgi:hypothetical protein